MTVPAGPFRVGLSVFHQVLVLSLLGTVIGVVVSLCAIGFPESVVWLNDRLLVSPRTRIQYEEGHLLVASATVLVPAMGGLIVGLIFRFLVPKKRAGGRAAPFGFVASRRISGRANSVGFSAFPGRMSQITKTRAVPVKVCKGALA